MPGHAFPAPLPGEHASTPPRPSGPERSRLEVALWRAGLWLRRSVPLFQEERILGRALILLRALWQLPSCIMRDPSHRSFEKAWLCLRLAFRYTMVSPRLLFRMYDIAEETGESPVEGALVECGVWNGGSAALLAVAAMGRRGDRDVWLFDSFEGLPPPTERDPEPVRANYFRGWNRGSESRVREVWRLLRLPATRLHVVRGWFRDSFPRARVGSIAVLHIDCDWYDSVRQCLEAWYDRVRPGGVIILNDYNLYTGANDAVHDFLAARGARVQIHLLGSAGAWFPKPRPGSRRGEAPWPRRPRPPRAGQVQPLQPDASPGPIHRPEEPRARRSLTDSGVDLS